MSRKIHTMSHANSDAVSQWTTIIQDVIATDSSIREGLYDDSAIALIEWGRTQAAQLAARLVAENPDLDEETVNTYAGALVRLMTVISRAVVHRHKQGADWLDKVFKRLNKTSERVYGEGAPVMSEDAISAWIAGHADRSDDELLRDLLQRFSPAAPPVTPLSDAVDLPDWSPSSDSPAVSQPPGLPGRSANSTSEEAPSSPTGENHEQE